MDIKRQLEHVKNMQRDDEPNRQRVVQVVNETSESMRVKIRNMYSPIFSRLWEISRKTLEAFHTDIVHDALMLSRANDGDKFLWGYRNTGTSMIKLTGNKALPRTIATVIMASNDPETLHLIEVARIRDNYADGYVAFLNVKDIETLTRIVKDNM